MIHLRLFEDCEAPPGSLTFFFLTRLLTYRVFMVLVGDIFEHAVVLSVKMEDQDAFERHFLQLKSYYTDTRYTFSFLA